ncbi:hypothetical protein, partial [Sphingosinithalassobacter portus]|uniref:hypothetical protein n=1 Tax=Stakelama portus TaxID=2676234 RepID=UPI0019616B74
MVAIRNHEKLRDWLDNKPVDWARAMALRSALRVLPFAVRSDRPALHIAVFRATAISWSARKFPDQDIA